MAEDDDKTAGAELDWDKDDLERFLAEADPDFQAPTDTIVEADE